MTQFMPPPPPGQSPPLAQFLGATRSALLELVSPTQPQAVFACTESALPAAEAFRHCLALLLDRRALVISTYTGSAWEWTNADGSTL